MPHPAGAAARRTVAAVGERSPGRAAARDRAPQRLGRPQGAAAATAAGPPTRSEAWFGRSSNPSRDNGGGSGGGGDGDGGVSRGE
eukprot:267819-Chlamydomonas_euryale.AAC.1